MVMVGAAVSCSKDDDGSGSSTEKNELMTSSIESYVDDVVIPTYSSLATGAMALYDACYALNGGSAIYYDGSTYTDENGDTFSTSNITEAKLEAAAAAWVSARKYWENSEAFLFGPAGDYAIDPRIDSWPLDQSALETLLTNANNMAGFYADADDDESDPVAYAGELLGNTLLGFHAVEFILFNAGEARTPDLFGNTDLDPTGTTSDDAKRVALAYLLGIVGDLRNQCILLEHSWAGADNISDEKAQIMEDTELGRAVVYGDVLKEAGDAGNSYYKSQKAAMSEILNGLITIIDEVGNTKIQDPIDSKNALDVESWFSYNSITDFTDNIKGCQMAYAKISDYIKSLDEDIDADVQAKFTTAITEIGGTSGSGWDESEGETDNGGMKAPFRDYVTTGTATTDQQEAITACNNLMAAVEAADEIVNAQ